MDCSAVVILSSVDKKKKKKNVYSSERFQIISDAHNNFDFILSFDFNIEIFKNQNEFSTATTQALNKICFPSLYFVITSYYTGKIVYLVYLTCNSSVALS